MQRKLTYTAVMATTASAALLAGISTANAQGGPAVCRSTLDYPAFDNCVYPTSAAPGGGSFPGSFLVPGTNTSFAIHGVMFIEAERLIGLKGASGDEGTGVNGNSAFQGPGATATQILQHRNNGGLAMDAKAERPNIETRTPTPYGEFKTYLEFDFNQTAGVTLAGNKNLMRMRQAFGTLGPWLFGQTKTLFEDTQVFPDLWDAGFDAGQRGSSIYHVPQLRYTWLAGNGITVAGSLELNSNQAWIYGTTAGEPATPYTASGTTSGAFDTLGNSSTTGYSNYPIAMLAGQLDQPWGHVRLGVAMTDDQVRNTGTTTGLFGKNGINHEQFAYAALLSGHYNMGFGAGGKDRIAGGVEYDAGITRLMNTMNSDYVINTTSGTWQQQRQWGMFANYTHFWSPMWRSTASGGYVRALNTPSGFNLGELAVLNRGFISTHINIVYAPLPELNFYLEWAHQHQVQASGANETQNVIAAMARVYF